MPARRPVSPRIELAQYRRPASRGRDRRDRNLLAVREAATEDRDLAPGLHYQMALALTAAEAEAYFFHRRLPGRHAHAAGYRGRQTPYACLQDGRRPAGYVARVLAGTLPRDLPVEPINRPGLAINLKTAKAIGIGIPPCPDPHRRGDRMRV